MKYLALFSIVLTLIACKKQDTESPELQLLGGDTLTQFLPSTAGAGVFIDPGWIAEDGEDGPLTGNVLVESNVNPNRKGTYTIFYSVTDEAGNITSKTRTVFIINASEHFGGNYMNCRDTLTSSNLSYTATILVSDTVNRLVKIQNFSNYGRFIWSTLYDSTLNVPLGQYLDSNATRFINNIFTPPSFILSNAPPTRIRIKYSWTDGMNSDTCTTWLQR